MNRAGLVLLALAACSGLTIPERLPFTPSTTVQLPSTTVELIPSSTVTATSPTADTLAPEATAGPVVTAVTVAPPLVTAVATTTSTTLPVVTVVPTSPPITVPELAVVFSAPAEALLTASTNLVRTSVGLVALIHHADLDFYARVWAGHLSTIGELDHSNIDTLLGPWLIVGENVAAGTDMGQVADALANSPDHYATMVDPAYLHTGVGVAVDPSGRLWVCQIFGGTVLP